MSTLEATAPVDISCAVTQTAAATSASSAATAAAKLGESASLAGDPLSLVHPLHDLVDVVDCLASHGLQSSLVPRIESVLSARYTGGPNSTLGVESIRDGDFINSISRKTVVIGQGRLRTLEQTVVA